MFNSAATVLIKNPFFLKYSVFGGFGLNFRCPLRCPVQLGGSLVTVCLPRLHPAVVWFALLLQALLWYPPRPAAESLCCSVLPRQQQAASAVGIYLSRDGLSHQWQAASAVGVYLNRCGLPRQRLAASAVGMYLSRGMLPR